MAPAQNNLATLFLGRDQIDLAIQGFENALKADPTYLHAYRNLGQSYYRKGDLKHAAAQYRLLFEKTPATPDLLLEFAQLLEEMGNTGEAINILMESIQAHGQQAQAYDQLGTLLQGKGDYEEALSCHEKSIDLEPASAQAHVNLGNALKLLNRYEEAEAVYRKAIEMNPGMALAFCNLGVVLNIQGRDKEAIEVYENGLKNDPTDAEAWGNLGLALVMQDSEKACEYLEKALELNPNRVEASYILNAIKGKTPEAAPAEYVKKLFDDFSARFDENLDYKTPTSMRELVESIRDPESRFHQVLDLGCGTGLCAAAFAPLCDEITGVDISEGMISEARKKDLYSRLETSEILEFLHQCQESYDLILAADVFVYFGDLKPLFKSLRSRCKAGTQLIFSTEALDDDPDYLLRTTGRFAHSKTYLEQLSQESGFRILKQDRQNLRKEKEDWIEGNLFILEAVEV